VVAAEGIPRVRFGSLATVWLRGALAVALCAGLTHAADRTGLWVQFKPGSEERSAALMARLSTAGHLCKRAVDGVSDERLASLHARAERGTGKLIDDPRLTFVLVSPNDDAAAQAINELSASGDVAWVEPAYPPMPPPAPIVPPDFENQQRYRVASPVGIGATNLSGVRSADGSGVTIADLEYSWNLAHADLPTASRIGPAPVDPFNNDNHGTAVLGVLAARNDTIGTVGIAPAANLRVVAANTAAGYNLASAITTAAAALTPGDVLLIEQQIVGPNYTGNPAGTQVGLVPIEWQRAAYNAVITAIGNGITVVIAAGNGTQNLDDPIYNTAPGGHRPFRPEGDSGSIIVGAGAANPGSATPRSRLSYSNFGAALDLQGWGEQVWTTGYGDAFNATGKNSFYTSSFAGTSSGAAIVAGAAALLQSAYRAETGLTLPPRDIRDALRAAGSPQTSGAHPASQNIGPLPDVRAALDWAVARAPLPPAAFTLAFPTGGATVSIDGLVLSWNPAVRAASYRVQLDDAPDFATPIIDATVSASALPVPPDALDKWRAYYWRVTASNSFGTRLSDLAPATFTIDAAGCSGDVTHDGRVDFGDLTLVLSQWGGQGPLGDADGNGTVDSRDVLTVLLFWGVIC
jgi:hypothetical protein